MCKRVFQYAAIISVTSLIIFSGNIATAENSYTYTNCDKATLLNVNCDGSQIQMNDTATPFPFINVAASARGTVVRANTRNGNVIGEYLSAPEGQWRNPSRTTVDLYGNVWVGNRDEGSNYKGSVVKIGLVTGGTRCDKDGTDNSNGEYLKPPFKYNTCIDRNGDGLIKTSRGLGDIRAWSNANWADSSGGVSTADDECICNYVRTNGTNVRHVSVDKNNNVWVGGYTNGSFDLLDGDTGAVLATFNKGLSPYGGLVDGKGVLWSSIRASNGLLRYDPKGTFTTNDDTWQFFPTQDSYGMGIDSYGNIWLAQAFARSIYKFNSDGTVYPGFPKYVVSSIFDGIARGVAVTPKDNHVWVALSQGGNKVARLDNNGNILKHIPVGAEPTGVAVDSDGKVWVCNYSSNNLMRINPLGGC